MKYLKLNILTLMMGGLLQMLLQGCAPQHANYPVTRVAGWAPEEHVPWQTLKLSAQFEDQSFSLYKSKTRLLIQAQLKADGFRTATFKINKLHISQRYIMEDLQAIAGIPITAPGNPPKPDDLFIKQYREKHQRETIPFTVIEITPIFEIDQRFTAPQSVELELDIAEPIQNKTWGRNYYRVILGDRHLDLATHQ